MAHRHYMSGLFYAIAAFGLWGFLPLYWRLLSHVPVIELVGHRILWSAVFIALLLLARGSLNLKYLLSSRRNLLFIIAGALLIVINWGTFIYAIATDQLVQASLGYYINPLFSVLLGLLVLKERLMSQQWIALGLAFIGVLIMTLRFEGLPWIALVLTLTFGLYGLIKKMARLDPLQSLGMEMLLLSPITIAMLATRMANGSAIFLSGAPWIDLLLIGGGIMTALPLYLFGMALARARLSLVGFLQYIGPTIMLLLGVFSFGEAFGIVHLISFGCVWVALGIYSLSMRPLR